MQLLVSVADATDASQALSGGADWIDAKDPSQGPLGRVTGAQLRRICRVVGDADRVSAALGDVSDASAAQSLAVEYGRSGAALLKIGLGYVAGADAVTRLTRAAVDALASTSLRTGIVAVAYADDGNWAARPGEFAAAAADGGAVGVLLDTARKNGLGLCSLFSRSQIRVWISAVHDAGLFAAVAGRLNADALARVAQCGADVAGVRGAACDGGRTGLVTAERVIALRTACRQHDRQARRSA